MIQICCGSPLPTFDSLYSSFAEHLTFPPPGLVLPAMPTLPSPMFPSAISAPNLEMVKTAVELQSAQLMTTCMAMIQPLVDFLGLDLLSVLPAIPGVNLNLSDILSVNPSALVDAVKEAMVNGIDLPFVPIPFYERLGIPDMSAIQAAANLSKAYVMMLPGFIYGLIDEVTAILDIAGMPALPAMPDFDTVKQTLMSMVPGAESVTELLSGGLSMSELFSSIAIPGFPGLSGIPSPLIPSISIPEFEFHEAVGVLQNHLSTFSLSLIMDFIDSVLSSFIGFSFPSICIPLAPQS